MGVCGSDLHQYHGSQSWKVNYPVVLGHEFGGHIVEVGKEVTYEVKISNPGTGPCTNVQLIVELADSTSATDAKGPTVGRTTGQQILFDPIGTVGVKGDATYRIKVKGTQPGDMRFRVKMTCDQNRTAVVKEENTRFYKE